jgi:hypothetical protein
MFASDLCTFCHISHWLPGENHTGKTLKFPVKSRFEMEKAVITDPL